MLLKNSLRTNSKAREGTALEPSYRYPGFKSANYYNGFDETKMLAPNPVAISNVDAAAKIRGFDLFASLPPGGYFNLHWDWHRPDVIPKGYDYYIVHFHHEHIDFEWLEKQQVDKKIIVLMDFNTYPNSKWPPNCIPLRWIYWHHALRQMIELFGTEYNKNIKYKASAFCNRITQSKLVTTTALLETLDKDELLVSVSDWLENKNVHNWQLTGNRVIDALTSTFRKKYMGKLVKMDDFTNEQNYHHVTANPSQIAYQEASLHFTNESFHYSQMHDQVVPGPMLTEKTFKCLLGGTAFITVGQFDVYRSLEQLGMHFNYGELDLSFDNDPGNLSRLESIVKLVYNLTNYTADELYGMTKDSSEHNQKLVTTGEFFHNCQINNLQTLEQIKSIVQTS